MIYVPIQNGIYKAIFQDNKSNARLFL